MIASQVSQPTVGELMKLRSDLDLAWLVTSDLEKANAFRRASQFIGSLPLGTKIKTFHYKRSAGQ